MPKETYYNINEQKQKKLIDVGIHLFSSNTFEAVDVQMVVNMANLPRGSFYAYFEDMEDYYNLVISSFKSERIKMVTTMAEDFKGSLFDFLIELFKYDIAQYAQEEKKLLLAYYYRFLQTRKIGSFEETIFHSSEKIGIYEILASLKVNIDNKIQLGQISKASLIDFAMTVYLSTYNICVNDKMSEEESLKLFIERIKIIERGVK